MTGEADSLNFRDNTKTEVFSFPSQHNGRTEKFGNLPMAQSGVEMGSDARQSDTMVTTWSLYPGAASCPKESRSVPASMWVRGWERPVGKVL